VRLIHPAVENADRQRELELEITELKEKLARLGATGIIAGLSSLSVSLAFSGAMKEFPLSICHRAKFVHIYSEFVTLCSRRGRR
jgi:hypothetical protein